MSALASPKSAEWLATMRCNLQCAHCCADAGQPWDDELGTDEACRMLADLADLGVEHLCISGGELTLRPDWEKLVATALERVHGVAIITNGRLGRRLLDTLHPMKRSERLTVIVSVDGGRDAHDARRGTGSFEKAIELLEAKTSLGRTILTTVARDNSSELEPLRALVERLGVQEWSIQPAIPMGRMPADDFLGEDGLRALADFIHAARAGLAPRTRVSTNCTFGYFHAMRGQDAWHGCPAGRDHLVVLANGDVSGCVAVPGWTSGNVRSEPISAIWEGSRMAALRDARPAGCTDCARCARGCEVMQTALRRQFCTLE